LKSRALGLADIVKFQDGAVVSREIIGKKAGTVTLFSFDAGQGLSEHAAPFDALVIAIEGDADITISAKTHRLNKGQFIIMPAGEPHALKALTPFKMLLVMIRS